MKFLKNHSLSIFLGLLWVGLSIAAFLLPEGSIREFVHGHATASFGAFVVVLATKWLYEKGSAQSKEV